MRVVQDLGPPTGVDLMPDARRIDPVLVEKAVEAFEKAPEYPGEGPDTTDRDAMEAAIVAVFDEAVTERGAHGSNGGRPRPTLGT